MVELENARATYGGYYVNVLLNMLKISIALLG